jgi:hypothetical protein
MPGMLDSYNLELFQIDKKRLVEISNQLLLRKYRAYIPRPALDLFRDDADCLWHLTEVLRAKEIVSTVVEQGSKNYLVTIGDHGLDCLSPYFMKDRDYKITLNDEGSLKLDLSTDHDFTTFRRLVTRQLKIDVKEPLTLSGLDIVDKSDKIIDSPSGNTSALRLLSHCCVYRAASLRFRKYGETYFLQIVPRAKIELDTQLNCLISEGIVDKDTFSRLVSSVRLPNDRSTKILKVLEKKASDKITESTIFEGRSFIEFADDNYPFLGLKNRDSIMVGVSAESGPALFSLESLSASLTFYTLKLLDEEFLSNLGSLLKFESAKRLDRAVNWIMKIAPMKIGQIDLQIDVNPFEMMVLNKPFETDLSDLDPQVPGGIFKSPPISFRTSSVKSDGKHNEIEIPSGYLNKYQATVNDLRRNPELKPLDVPEKPKVIAFVQKDLKNGWNALSKALFNGIEQQGYRGFQKTFGTEPVLRTRYIKNFLSKEFDLIVSKLKLRQYQCAVVVIPRFLGTPEETRRIYTEPKVKIMEKGIPVQVITDDPRVTEGSNNTLLGKSVHPYTCFGIALNILVKLGAVITALAPSFSDNLLPKSVVIGYNVIRVPLKDEEMLKSLYSTRRTIPLSAPLVIFDSRGAKVSHHWVYRLRDETSLFEGDSGKDILSHISSDVENIVIHKDGPFFPVELENIVKLFGRKKVFPISIIRNEVPRIFNPKHKGAGFELDAGSFIALSKSDYVMTTTPIFNWRPERNGWPCPILVRFHGKDIENDPLTQRKLLFQIYALTKMQIGSQRATRVPISIHYSNMIERFIRKVGEPTTPYLRFFVTSPDQRFISKWYA